MRFTSRCTVSKHRKNGDYLRVSAEKTFWLSVHIFLLVSRPKPIMQQLVLLSYIYSAPRRLTNSRLFVSGVSLSRTLLESMPSSSRLSATRSSSDWSRSRTKKELRMDSASIFVTSSTSRKLLPAG